MLPQQHSLISLLCLALASSLCHAQMPTYQYPPPPPPLPSEGTVLGLPPQKEGNTNGQVIVKKQMTTTPDGGLPTTPQVDTTTTEQRIFTARPVENPDVYGCKFPVDLGTRARFCAKQAELTLPDNQDLVLDGIFSQNLLQTISTNCKATDGLDKTLRLQFCPGPVKEEDLSAFIAFWSSHVSQIAKYDECLRSNVHAMVKLCGEKEHVSDVVSGAGGLHLNLLDIMKSLSHLVHDNSTAAEAPPCLHQIVESLHTTVVLYERALGYEKNAVMCYAAGRTEHVNPETLCGTHKDEEQTCSQFAGSLQCLVHTCAATASVGNALSGIQLWNWYFNAQSYATTVCKLPQTPDEQQCRHLQRATVEAGGAPTQVGNETFTDSVKKTFRDIAAKAEDVFHLPARYVFAIFAASLALISGVCAVFCLWYRGRISCDCDGWDDEGRSRKHRYRQLGAQPTPEEMRALAEMDEYEDDDYD